MIFRKRQGGFKLRIVFLLFLIVALIKISGIHLQLMERDYFTQFSYPMESPNFIEIVGSFRYNSPDAINPMNPMYSDMTFVKNTEHSNIIERDCNRIEPYQFLILVKSAPKNKPNRDAIRATWKQGASGITSKTIFFMGKSYEDITEEKAKFGDIVEINYVDTYYNNTLKTVMEMRFAAEQCPNFHYVLLVDDDYFVSLKNLYRFTQDNLDTEKLYAGFTMFTKPLRHKFFNKWFVSLDEYPFSRWPKYVTAGAILLSKPALMDIYYATFFVKHFRFDDIFVALCAKKMGIEPTHSEQFKFWEESGEHSQQDLIAAHGYRDPQRLIRFWEVQQQNNYV